MVTLPTDGRIPEADVRADGVDASLAGSARVGKEQTLVDVWWERNCLGEIIFNPRAAFN